MLCQTCNHEDNVLGKGVIQQNLRVIPCPDCRDGELKLWYGLNFLLPSDDPITAISGSGWC